MLADTNCLLYVLGGTKRGNMKGEERLIPYKRIRRFLRQETKGMVCKKACESMQNYLENFTKQLCRDVVSEHQEQNRLRKFHGLPEHKRIQVSEFISLFEKNYKQTQSL